MFRSWKRFAVVILFSLVTPTLLLLIYTSRTVGNRSEREAFRALQVLNSVFAHQVAEELVGVGRYVESFASRRALVQAAAQKDVPLIEAQLKAMAENHGRNIRAVFVLTNGVMLAAEPPETPGVGNDCSQQEWFRGVSERNAPYISGVYEASAFSGEPVVMIVAPVLNAGVTIGFLGAQYQVSDLSSWIGRVLNDAPETVVIADQHGAAVLDEENLLPEFKKARGRRAGSDSDEASPVDYKIARDGQEKFVAERGIPELGWSVYAVLPRTAALQSLVETRQVILASFIVFAALFTGVSLVWLKTLYRYAGGLERSNRYLEYLCYTIAHNFRAPLRAVAGFAELLREKIHGEVDQEGAEYFNRIIEGGHLIDEMVNDLLLFGKLSHAPLKPERVNLKGLLDEILRDLRDDLETHHAVLRIAPELGGVYADRWFLRIALRELIGNAAKFVAPERSAEITVAAEVFGNKTRVWVRDMGPGIDPRFHEQIFELFLKLDNGRAGTGVGLALARSAVERMGGAIGLKSRAGEGAAFWIELPSG